MKISKVTFPNGAFLGSTTCWAKKDFDTGELIQQDGMYLWEVNVIVPDKEAESFKVVVPAKTNPVEKMTVMQPLQFDGKKHNVGVLGKNKCYT